MNTKNHEKKQTENEFFAILKISNPLHKRTILKRYGLCFSCFHKRHLASSCALSNYSCNKCKGKHNISICIDLKSQMLEIIQRHQVKVIR